MNNFLTAQISLFISPENHGEIKKGQPFFYLWNTNNVSLFEEPNWFLYKSLIEMKSSPSPHSWSAAAYDLKTWFQYLVAKGTDWRIATERERETFSEDYSLSISPRTGREYSEKTINRRLKVITNFYSFARKQGYYIGDIGDYRLTAISHEIPIEWDALAHTKTAGHRIVERDPLMFKEGRREKIKPFQVSDLKKIIAYLSPSDPHEIGSTQHIRDRLIIDLGWASGLRLNDVNNLTTLKFLNIIVAPGHEYDDFAVLIEKSKFNVTRNVAIPGWLILDIQKYIDGERQLSLKARKSRSKKNNTETKLFLGHANSKNAGKPISNNAIQKMITNSCLKAGVTEIVEFNDIDNEITIQKVVAKHSFHDLRHNCAVFTYHAEKANGNPEPWKVVQIKLGHKSLKVTVDTYLGYVEIFGKTGGLTNMRNLLGML